MFILSPLVGDGFSNIGVKLTTASLPAAPVSPITVSAANGPRGLRAGSTLNLVTGGTLINNFAAVNSTLNISGGNTGDGLEVVGSQVFISGGVVGGLHAFSGSTVSVSGGEIQSNITGDSLAAFTGAVVNVTGGDIGGSATANSGSQWNISGGHFNQSLIANAGSNVKITGGKFSDFQVLNGSTVSISAGQFQPYFIASGNGVSLEGGEFRLNGAPYAGSTATLAPTDVLTGVLTDGNEFIFTPMERDALTGVSLVQRSIPDAGPSTVTVDSATAPLAGRVGQTINLVAGGMLPDFFPIVSGTFNVAGGTAGNGLKAERSQINVTSGSLGSISLFNSNMQVQGGNLGAVSGYYTHVDILPGSTSGGFTLQDGSSATMTGGAISAVILNNGATFTMTAGSLGGLTVYANSAAHLSNATINAITINQNGLLDVTNTTMSFLSASDAKSVELTNANVTNTASLSGFVNFYSGSLPFHTKARQFGVINIRGGSVGANFTADSESVVNILGGTIGNNFLAGLQSKVTISGGTVGNSFSTNDICTVNITGGSVGSNFTANSSATVTISGGTVGDSFTANTFSTIKLTGGSLGNKLNVAGGTFTNSGGAIGSNAIVQSLVSTARAKLTMTSGSIGDHFRVQGYFSQPNPNIAPVIGPATFEISGGTIGSNFSAGISSIVNISGGTFGDLFVAEKGSTINLFGTSFLLGGNPIPGLTLGVPFTVTNRDVTLSGFLVDGSPFSFDLHSTGTTTDRFDPLTTLTLTLKAGAVPEPATAALLLMALSSVAGVTRVRRLEASVELSQLQSDLF